MNDAQHDNPPAQDATHEFRQALTEARVLLSKAADKLRGVLQEEAFRAETPIEVEAALDMALDAIGAAIRRLESTDSAGRAPAPNPGEPTRQQGQFLAYIREYRLLHQFGAAPSHADFQRFFNLTPPSVNSMLIRLEQRGFIRRVPGKARAIELTVNPDWIPPLVRPIN